MTENHIRIEKAMERRQREGRERGITGSYPSRSVIYGFTTKKECSELLKGQPEGCAMVRFSEKNAGQLAVAYVKVTREEKESRVTNERTNISSVWLEQGRASLSDDRGGPEEDTDRFPRGPNSYQISHGKRRQQKETEREKRQR